MLAALLAALVALQVPAPPAPSPPAPPSPRAPRAVTQVVLASRAAPPPRGEAPISDRRELEAQRRCD